MLGKRINNWRVYKGGTPFQQYARMKLIERKVDKKLQSGFKGYAIVDQFGNLLHDTISEYGRKSVVLFLEKYDTTQDWHAISLNKTKNQGN